MSVVVVKVDKKYRKMLMRPTEENIDTIRTIVRSIVSDEEIVEATVLCYVESCTTLRKMRIGKVYNESVISLLQRNNPYSIKKEGKYWLMSEFSFNMLKSGIAWVTDYAKTLQRLKSKKHKEWLKRLTLEELEELL